MRTDLARRLAASTAAGALGVLLVAAPAFAQGQPRENRAAPQAGSEMSGGRGEMRGGDQVRGNAEVRGQIRSGRTERGTRADVNTRSNLRAEGTVRNRGDVRVQTRRDARIRSNVNTNVRADIRTDRRQTFSTDARWRDDRWRFRDRGPSFRVGVGISDPYYAYGYDDGYSSYAAAEPYAYRGYGDGYYSYGAAPGCTCAPRGAYTASWDNGWRGRGWGFSAW